MTVTHAKVSAKADGGDATLVRPSDWNAGHAGTNDHSHTATADGGVLTADKHASYSDRTAIAVPAAPAAGIGRDFLQLFAGRIRHRVIDAQEVSDVRQAALWFNSWYFWSSTSGVGTNGTMLGGHEAAVGAATYANALPTTTNPYTASHRSTYKNVVTTANQNVGIRMNEDVFFRGNAALMGGFFFACRFGIEAWTAGGRFFVGFCTGTTICAAQPSALLNMCGFGIDAADTAFTFMTNLGSGTATKAAIAGQPALAANQGYDAYIYMPPNASTIFYRLDNVNTGANIIESSTASTLPVVNTLMKATAMCGNAANAGAAAVGIGIRSIYIETNN